MRSVSASLVVLLSVSLAACGQLSSGKAPPARGGGLAQGAAPQAASADKNASAAAGSPIVAGNDAAAASDGDDSLRCSAAAAQQGAAQASVAVVVEGASRVQVGRAVEQVLGARYKVIPAKRYTLAAKRLRARQMKDRQVAKVADKLGADAVVHGVVRRKRGKSFLNVSVRNGATGEAIEQFVVPLRARRVVKGTRMELAERLYPAISCLVPAKPQIHDNKPAENTPAPEPEIEIADQDIVIEGNGQVVDDEVPAILSAR